MQDVDDSADTPAAARGDRHAGPAAGPIPAGGTLALAELVPGLYVRHPGQPDWGVGQVQSVIGHRVTVGFEHAGKLLINAAVVALVEARER